MQNDKSTSKPGLLESLKDKAAGTMKRFRESVVAGNAVKKAETDLRQAQRDLDAAKVLEERHENLVETVNRLKRHAAVLSNVDGEHKASELELALEVSKWAEASSGKHMEAALFTPLNVEKLRSAAARVSDWKNILAIVAPEQARVAALLKSAQVALADFEAKHTEK